MKIEDCERFHDIFFRDGVVNYWATYAGTWEYVTFGSLLATIKTRKLWKKWGHKTFSDYCRDELHLVPIYHENILIIVYLRLKHLGLHEDDMRHVERLYSLRKIAILSKYARTRSEFLRFCRKFAEATLPEIKSILASPPNRKRSLETPTTVSRSVVETWNLCQKATAKFFGVAQPEATRVMAVAVAGLIGNSAVRDKTVRRLARQAGLTTETAGKIIELLVGRTNSSQA